MRLTTLQLATRNLLLHKLRSFLTMLGTILGVGSVIAMLAIGEGSKRHAVEQIRQLGATNVIVRSVKPKRDGVESDASGSSSSSQSIAQVLQFGLTYKDLERFRGALPGIRFAVPLSVSRRNAQHGTRRVLNARLLGTTPEYVDIKNLALRRGRFLTDVDLRTTANVAVLGAGAADALFSYHDPIDKSLLLGNGAYRVVGVLERQGGGASPGAMGQDDFNNDVYIPLSAARNRIGEMQMSVRGGNREFERTELSEITLAVWDENLVTQTVSMLRTLLKQTHRSGEDYEIQVPLELLQQAEKEKALWNLVLGSIAGISLLVGGIGIMNIMLATITERTREIGIRRALGAKRRDITLQFLIETVVLSSTGGALGVIVGVGIPISVTLATGIETAISTGAIILAFGISVGIGVVFGLYPARRAALMDPIEALRHE